MNAETAQMKKSRGFKTSPEEATVKTEDQQAEDKTTETNLKNQLQAQTVNNLRVLENIEVKLTVELEIQRL